MLITCVTIVSLCIFAIYTACLGLRVRWWEFILIGAGIALVLLAGRAAAISHPSPELLIREVAKTHGVPPRLALAIASVESNMNCRAPRGAAGEVGIMQVLPPTAYSVGVGRAELKTCYGAVLAGVRYLRRALSESEGDIIRAAYLYNAGVHKRPRIGKYGLKVRRVLYGG